jgi:hypothetical protein
MLALEDSWSSAVIWTCTVTGTEARALILSICNSKTLILDLHMLTFSCVPRTPVYGILRQTKNTKYVKIL